MHGYTAWPCFGHNLQMCGLLHRVPVCTCNTGPAVFGCKCAHATRTVTGWGSICDTCYGVRGVLADVRVCTCGLGSRVGDPIHFSSNGTLFSWSGTRAQQGCYDRYTVLYRYTVNYVSSWARLLMCRISSVLGNLDHLQSGCSISRTVLNIAIARPFALMPSSRARAYTHS